MKLKLRRQAGSLLSCKRNQAQSTAPNSSTEIAGMVASDNTQSMLGVVAASVLLALCLLYFLISVSIGWRHSISDAHSFRQSQTAISVDTMLRGGPWLIYETPVLGPPWTIPFEFPLYQWIVAVLVRSTGLALEPVGRFVSVVFFLLTLWPVERLLAALRVSLPCRFIILALLISSPFYIFWSRTFLIESTALFLATLSLACTHWTICRPSASRLVVLSAISSLAAVVKVTTFFPLLIASIAVGCYQARRRGAAVVRLSWIHHGLIVIAGAGLPALALITWTYAADSAKRRSILGTHITSTSLQSWNFGTLEQRLSAETWTVLTNRMNLPLGQQYPLALAALGLIIARRRLIETAGCLLLYFVGILTFTNLFYVHDYYYFANNMFLVVAVGMAIVAMIESGLLLKTVAIAGLALLLGSMVLNYNQIYRPVQCRNALAEQRLATAIRDHTGPDDVIVVLGFDWSSEIPYYCHRHALCLPNWANSDEVDKCLTALTSYRIGAVVILPPAQKPIPCDIVLALLRKQGYTLRASPVVAPFELLLPLHRMDATGCDTSRR
jgi:hypothetical protein